MCGNSQVQEVEESLLDYSEHKEERQANDKQWLDKQLASVLTARARRKKWAFSVTLERRLPLQVLEVSWSLDLP